MRRLKNADGEKLAAPRWFEKLRDGRHLPKEERSQKKRYKQIFKVLKKAGIRRGNLYMAWDFTVGSRKSLTQTLLHIRNACVPRARRSGPGRWPGRRPCPALPRRQR